MAGQLAGLAVGLVALSLGAARADEEKSGFFPDVRVGQPTRLDWEFAVRGLPAREARVSSAYDSRRQRYQLFVPATYDTKKTWPMVVFLSPGDDPLGWRAWEKVCEANDIFFCAAYGAGNNSTPGRRLRVALDVLDDVRRHYRIDPDRTYAAGFSSGAQLACALAFALPEYFGGVVAVGGSAPLHRLAHLRHRTRDRLSVALVAGATDPARRELEDYTALLLADLGVRTRTWVVPKLGHALPPPAVQAQAFAWLEADLKRRRDDGRDRAGLAASADEVQPRRVLAARSVERAEAELKRPAQVYRAVSLLEAVASRYDKTAAAATAARRLKEIRADPRVKKLLADQAGREERRALVARARAEERFGKTGAALRSWRAVLKEHPGSSEAAKAAGEVKRLEALRASTPYLGAAFDGDTTAVRSTAPGGPAHRAGLRRGDRVVQVGSAKVGSLAELRRRVGAAKPGDKLDVAVRRGDKTLTLTVQVGAPPDLSEPEL
jgi:pimeloyl-ACP methyl ester carboxylesterase